MPQAMKSIYYAGQPGDGFGWGVCNRHLKEEIEKVYPIQRCPAETVIMPLADHDFNPISSARGTKRNLAYTFFEYPLGKMARSNAAKYDVVFCGSTWCLERMAAAGIKNGKTLIQGVDGQVFFPKPNPRNDDEFWIFSGGKFEYRKGQDLVLAAFREISRKYPKTRLITVWQNPWPSLYQTMAESREIQFALMGKTWGEQVENLCRLNGIDPQRVVAMEGSISQKDLADIYHHCDVGLFPNRCEGGTNLVSMEFMACGRPIVTHALTGQGELWNAGTMLYNARLDENFWAVSKAEDIVAAVERAIQNRDSLSLLGEKAADAMREWTWERAARTILEYA